MASDIDLTLGPVARALDELQVRFYVCGSVASSVYGEMRATADIDLVAELRANQAHDLATQLGEAYFADEIAMREAISSRSSFNLIHQQTFVKVDIFAPQSRPYDEQVLQRRQVEKLGVLEDSISAPLAAPEDTVIAKLEWFRLGGESSDRQWRDILGVLKFQYFDLDFEYMKHWTRNIGIADLLERALRDAGIKDD